MVSSPPLGAGGRGPGVSLGVTAPEGPSEAEPVLFGSVPVTHALAQPSFLASVALGLVL